MPAGYGPVGARLPPGERRFSPSRSERRRPGVPVSIGSYLVADSDRTTFEDVGAKTAPVHEIARRAGRRRPLQPGARLGEPLPLTQRLAESEPPAEQRVEIDAAADDVASGRLGRQVHAVLGRQDIERLRLDEGERLTPPARSPEAPLAERVSITLDADPRDRRRAPDRLAERARVREAVDRLNRAARCVPSRERQRRGSDHPAFGHLPRAGRDPRRRPGHARRSVGHHDVTVAPVGDQPRGVVGDDVQAGERAVVAGRRLDGVLSRGAPEGQRGPRSRGWRTP